MYSHDWINGNEYAVAFIGTYRTNATPRSRTSSTCKNDQRYARKESKDKRNEEREEAHTSATGGSSKKHNKEIQVGNTEQETEARMKEMERIQKLERENEKLKNTNMQLERRSREITMEMSKRTDESVHFENVNDELNHSRLAQRFQSLYSNEWVLLARWMSKTFRNVNELDRISFLTELMKRGFQECKISADTQIRAFLQANSVEDIPADEDLSELLQLRRRYAVRSSVRESIKREISNKLLQLKDVCDLCSGENETNAKKKLQTFLNEYIDCCWLMTVSNPAMVLDFDVTGKLYSDCVNQFTVYSTKKPVEDMTNVEGTIFEVVWPCVHRKDAYAAIYMKGDVVVVKKGIQQENSD